MIKRNYGLRVSLKLSCTALIAIIAIIAQAATPYWAMSRR